MHYMILYTPDTEKYMDFIIIDNDLKRGDKIKKKEVKMDLDTTIF